MHFGGWGGYFQVQWLEDSLELRRTGFKCWFCHRLPEWPWVNHYSSLPQFTICIMGKDSTSLSHWGPVSVRTYLRCSDTQTQISTRSREVSIPLGISWDCPWTKDLLPWNHPTAKDLLKIDAPLKSYLGLLDPDPANSLSYAWLKWHKQILWSQSYISKSISGMGS